MKAAPKQANNNSNRSATETTQGDWQKQSAQVANNSSKAALTQRAFISGINDSPRMLAQRRQIAGYLGAGQPPISEPAPPASPIAQQPIQRLEKPDDEEQEVLQPKFAPEPPAQLERQATPKPNNTGLPDNLKSGIESLSGMSMDHVKVHYNSSQPAQLNALAYAQGTDIHVAPGQEQHLPHEAWHVVQQAQGRVKPTMQAKGIPINDDKELEHEADVIEKKPIPTGSAQGISAESSPIDSRKSVQLMDKDEKALKRPPFIKIVNDVRKDSNEKFGFESEEIDMAHRLSWKHIETIVNGNDNKEIKRLIDVLMVPQRSFGPIKKGHTPLKRKALELLRAGKKKKPELLRLLNSSPYNLRPGDSGQNRANGQSFDPNTDAKGDMTPQSEALSEFAFDTFSPSSTALTPQELKAFEKEFMLNWVTKVDESKPRK